MFNGIVQKTGIIKNISKNKNNCIFGISSAMKFKKNEIGSSICCSGACLTLDSFNDKIFNFFISKETMNKTNFKLYRNGDIVNLEKSLLYGDRISGHFVQGHIDTTAKVRSIKKVGKSILINFKISKKFSQYIVYKGSISINGISLTVSKIINNGFEVAIIPHTLKSTNLIYLKKNKLVNIEFDILGKYIKRFLK